MEVVIRKPKSSAPLKIEECSFLAVATNVLCHHQLPAVANFCLMSDSTWVDLRHVPIAPTQNLRVTLKQVQQSTEQPKYSSELLALKSHTTSTSHLKCAFLDRRGYH